MSQDKRENVLLILDMVNCELKESSSLTEAKSRVYDLRLVMETIFLVEQEQLRLNVELQGDPSLLNLSNVEVEKRFPTFHH